MEITVQAPAIAVREGDSIFTYNDNLIGRAIVSRVRLYGTSRDGLVRIEYVPADAKNRGSITARMLPATPVVIVVSDPIDITRCAKAWLELGYPLLADD